MEDVERRRNKREEKMRIGRKNKKGRRRRKTGG